MLPQHQTFQMCQQISKMQTTVLPHLELLVNAGDNKEIRNAHSSSQSVSEAARASSNEATLN